MASDRVIEISSSSTAGFENAISKGIARAYKTVENIRGAWIKEQSMVVEAGDIKNYRVDLNIMFAPQIQVPDPQEQNS